jgi:hypothetical protein
MRYKDSVLKKLEEVENLHLGLQSLLGNPATTLHQVENQFDKIKNKIEDVRTLINTEQG